MYKKRNYILVTYVSSGCKFLFCLSHSRDLLRPNNPPASLSHQHSFERIAMHYQSYMPVPVHQAAPTHDATCDAMAVR